jgi:hypothetical protein
MLTTGVERWNTFQLRKERQFHRWLLKRIGDADVDNQHIAIFA